MNMLNTITIGQTYFMIEVSEFDRLAHEYVTMIYTWGAREKRKALEYLEKADNRSWWKIFEPTKEEYEEWAKYYFDQSDKYEKEARKMLMLIYEEY